ncbi:MAG: hypothetical protein ACRDTG_33020 [Pseudonocardiaceae bacterium]
MRACCHALVSDPMLDGGKLVLPVRCPWANEYRGRAMVLYGHIPALRPEWVDNTMCLDTGCVLGGKLTALRYPEKEIAAVPAERVWYEPAKPFLPDEQLPTGEVHIAQRDPDVLDIADMLDSGWCGPVATAA